MKPEYRAWFAERMAVYAAMIEQMDRGVGKIVDAVQGAGRTRQHGDPVPVGQRRLRRGDLDPARPGGRRSRAPPATAGRCGWAMIRRSCPALKTPTRRTGWNGRAYSNTPFRRFKSFVHEGGISTPLIASWPSHIGTGIAREPGHIIDIMPTLLELAGGTYPTEFNGHRIKPHGRAAACCRVLRRRHPPRAVYVWEHEGNRAIREGDWKLVSRLPAGGSSTT